MIDPIMSFWNLAPLIPIVEGAGGIITDWQGQPATNSHSCVAATPGLHSHMIKILAQPKSVSKALAKSMPTIT